MPRQISEITSGAQFTRSAEEGRLADSQTRVFRVLLDSPGEVVDIQAACGIRVGDGHPYNTNIFCNSFDARYDGESRMVLLCSFQYRSTAGSGGGGQDPKSQPPDIRPANWSTATQLIERPAREWYEVDDNGNIGGQKVAAQNPVGDIYDGVTFQTALVSISIEQYEPNDPMRHVLLVGCVNSETITLGSARMGPREVMFRGVSQKPVVESWGNQIYRGWLATYEFLYNPESWDLRLPVTGFNVKAFAPGGAGGSQDAYGQPLKHSTRGKIEEPLALPGTISVGDRVRAMVRVHSYDNGGASQLPSAQPVALNEDGTPRKGRPLIKRYCPYQPINLTERLGLKIG